MPDGSGLERARTIPCRPLNFREIPPTATRQIGQFLPFDWRRQQLKKRPHRGPRHRSEPIGAETAAIPRLGLIDDVNLLAILPDGFLRDA
jgi:hypothetical protein